MYILYDNRDKQQDCFNFIFRWEAKRVLVTEIYKRKNAKRFMNVPAQIVLKKKLKNLS